jgi:tRNA threonylcarbamoyladenosine biosynthesis protein TsaB
LQTFHRFMNLLALETSSATASVALSIDGRIRESSIASPREQTAKMLPLIGAMLQEAGLSLRALDAIVFGKGPGSFTGLRVAAAIAQGLAMSADRPVLAVSSLAALAQRVWHEWEIHHVLACVDARMSEVYWAQFAVLDGLAVLQGRERIGAASDVEAPVAAQWAAAGSGFLAYGETLAPLSMLAERVAGDLEPRARDLLPQAQSDLEAGRFVPLDAVLPSYLRDANAWRTL